MGPIWGLAREDGSRENPKKNPSPDGEGFVSNACASESFHQTPGEQKQIADEREPEPEHPDNRSVGKDRAENGERKQDYGNNDSRVVRRVCPEIKSRTPTATSTPSCLGHESPLVLA